MPEGLARAAVMFPVGIGMLGAWRPAVMLRCLSSVDMQVRWCKILQKERIGSARRGRAPSNTIRDALASAPSLGTHLM